MNDETRSWNDLAKDNARLRDHICDMSIELERTRRALKGLVQAVDNAGLTIKTFDQMKGSPDPETVDDRTRVYQSKDTIS